MIVPEYEILRSILSRRHTTIASLGAKVQTGKVVWNQVKSSLTDEESDDTIPLVYDHNIRNENTLDLSAVTKNKEKRRYVNKTAVSAEPTTTSSIVVRRGYGNTFKFRYAMAPPGIFGENHVNVITSPDADVLSKIYTSLGDEDTLRFGKIMFGNGSVSKTELESVIPIFTDGEEPVPGTLDT